MPPEPGASPGPHVHLDPVGGIAGDMFAAALLAARPDLQPGLEEALDRASLPASLRVRVEPDRRGGLSGLRFAIEGEPPGRRSTGYAEVAGRIEAAPLEPGVRGRAAAMLRLLAEAEAQVHGVALGDVHFHELGGWDTVVDLLAAAWLVEALAPSGWSVGPLPLGGGLVPTEHGPLPVPAPATALLLQGFEWRDDGVGGERVTPTGAAILRHLEPGPRPRWPMRLASSGFGLGTRRMEGVANTLRALVLEPVGAEGDAALAERVAVLRFEIDDQTPEELALGLERVRGIAGTLDVWHWPAVGKRGRLGAAVQVLAAPERLDAVAYACLAETSTLGLRVLQVERRALARDALVVGTAEGDVGVKRARRPGGAASAKAELRDLEASGLDQAGRERARRAVESRALLAEDGLP